ncbi:hypothetical protein HanPSC8_Chr05g0206221 [Helianthus annuus]|nr:hypothetical protein HanPSC8_Chr05g0206221 [Helianthus annuus]
MGARKDLAVTFLRLTQEEVEAFCLEWGIGLRFKPVAPGRDTSIDRCPPGSVALYCHHFEFSNLCHPFSNFVLNVLEYYHVSFGQIHPQGLARVLHFEVLCRASGYDPTLLSFRRFFRLAKSGDWFTFETSQVNTCLVSSMVTTLGAWKDRFFWVSDDIVPFKMVWRHPDAVLNELEPSTLEINTRFLEIIRMSPSRVCPFPEHLLMLLGISELWDRPDRDPMLMKDGQVMTLLMPCLDAEATPGEDAVSRGSEHRFEGFGYMNVPNVKGFTKVVAPNTSTRRSNRRLLKASGPPSTPEHIDLSDKIGASMDQGPSDDVGKEQELDVKIGDSFKDAAVCENVLNHIAPPLVHGTIAEMDDDVMLSRLMLSACNFADMLPQGVACFRKRMHEYEEFSKKRDKVKASIDTLKKDSGEFAKKEEAWGKKVEELNHSHETEVEGLKKQLEASLEEKNRLTVSHAQVANENKWHIEHGFQQVVSYLLHSAEFNSVLGDVYNKLLIHGRHQGYVAGYKACQSGDPQEKSSLYQPQAHKVFQDSVREMEHLTYPYVGEVSKCFGKPLPILQGLKLRGLDEATCREVLKSLSKKRSCSGDSEDTLSGADEGSKDPSLEASGTAAEEEKKEENQEGKRR